MADATTRNNQHTCQGTLGKRYKSTSCKCVGTDSGSLDFCCESRRDEHRRICPSNTGGVTVTFKKRRLDDDGRQEVVKVNTITGKFTCFCGASVRRIDKHVSHCTHVFPDEYVNPSTNLIESKEAQPGERGRHNDADDTLYPRQVPQPYSANVNQRFESILDGVVTRNAHLPHLYSCLICSTVMRSKASLLVHLGSEAHNINLRPYGLNHSVGDRKTAVRSIEETLGPDDVINEGEAYSGVSVVGGFHCSTCHMISKSEESLRKRHNNSEVTGGCATLSAVRCRIQAIPPIGGTGNWIHRIVPTSAENNNPYAAQIHAAPDSIYRWRQTGLGNATLPKNQYYEHSTLRKVVGSGNFRTFRMLVSGKNYDETDGAVQKLFHRVLTALSLVYINFVNETIGSVSNNLRGQLGNAEDDDGKFYKRLQSPDSVKAYGECLGKLLIFLYRLKSRQDVDILGLRECSEKLPRDAMDDLKRGVYHYLSPPPTDDEEGELDEEEVDEEEAKANFNLLNTVLRQSCRSDSGTDDSAVNAALAALKHLHAMVLQLLSHPYLSTESNASCPLWVFVALSQVQDDSGKLYPIGSATPNIAKLQFSLKGAALLGVSNIVVGDDDEDTTDREPFGFPPEKTLGDYIPFLGQRHTNSAMNILIHEFTVARQYENSDKEPKLTAKMGEDGKPDFDGFIINESGTLVTRETLAKGTRELISTCMTTLQELSFRTVKMDATPLKLFFDNPSNSLDGHGLREDRLASEVLRHLMERCTTNTTTEKQQYLEKSKTLLIHLATLIHVTSFACSRGTEMIEFQWENIVNMKRNIYISCETIVIVPSYNKRDAQTGQQKKTPRYLPPEVAVILYYYCTLVRPAASWASGSERNPFLFVNPATNIKWRADELRTAISTTFAAKYGLLMTFSQFRHIHCAFLVTYLTIAGSELQHSMIKAHDNKVHLHSGHTEETVNENYATLTSNFEGVVLRDLHFALKLSHRWTVEIFGLWKKEKAQSSVITVPPTGGPSASLSLLSRTGADYDDNGTGGGGRLADGSTMSSTNNRGVTYTSSPTVHQEGVRDNFSDVEIIGAMMSVDSKWKSYKSTPQRDYLRKLYGIYKRRIRQDMLFVLPTNTGKSCGVFILAKLLQQSASVRNQQPQKIVFVSPTNALLEDMQGKCSKYGIGAVRVNDEEAVSRISETSPEQVILVSCEFSSNETFTNALQRLTNNDYIDSVFIDEVHLLPKWKSFRSRIADGIVTCFKRLRCNIFYMTATLPLYLRDEFLIMIDSPGLKATEVRHSSLRPDIQVIRLACDITSVPAGGGAHDHYRNAMGERCAKVVEVVYNHVRPGEHPVTNVLIFVTQKGDIGSVKRELLKLRENTINIGIYHSGDYTADEGRTINDEAERQHAIALLRTVPRSGVKTVNVIICTTAFFVGVDEDIHVAISLGPLSDVVDTSQALGRLNRREKSRIDVGAFIVLHSTEHSNLKYDAWSRADGDPRRSQFTRIGMDVNIMKEFLNPSVCATSVLSKELDGLENITCFTIPGMAHCDYCVAQLQRTSPNVISGVSSAFRAALAACTSNVNPPRSLSDEDFERDIELLNDLMVEEEPLSSYTSVTSSSLVQPVDTSRIQDRITSATIASLNVESRRPRIQAAIRRFVDNVQCVGCFIKTGTEVKQCHNQYVNQCLDVKGLCCFTCLQSADGKEHNASNCKGKFNKAISFKGYCFKCSLPKKVGAYDFHQKDLGKCSTETPDLEPVIYYCYYKNADLRQHLNTYLSLDPGSTDLSVLCRKLVTRNQHSSLLYLTEVLYQVGALIFTYKGLRNINSTGIGCWSG